MKPRKFKAELLPGHKESAVEVPFDPQREWRVPPRRLWRGRHGHPVNARINGVSFESNIVPRQKKFYLLIDGESERAANVSPGDVIEVSVSRASSNETGKD